MSFPNYQINDRPDSVGNPDRSELRSSGPVVRLLACRRIWLACLAILFLCITAALAGSDKTTLRKLWASSRYSTNSVPAAWRPARIPETSSDVRAFESFSLHTQGLSIANFVAKYGLPHRYLTTKREGKHDFLIYDLSSGHSVALYVPKPPFSSFAACVIITSDGSLVRLIK